MSAPTDRCDVAYKWALPDGLPDAVGMEAGRRWLIVSPRALRVEHWPAHDSPGCLHVFIDGVRVRPMAHEAARRASGSATNRTGGTTSSNTPMIYPPGASHISMPRVRGKPPAETRDRPDCGWCETVRR